MPCYQLLSVAPSYWLAFLCTNPVTTQTPSAWNHGPHRSASTSDSHLPIPDNTGTSHLPTSSLNDRPYILQDALQGTNHLGSPWCQVHTLARQPGLHSPCGQPSVCFQNTAQIPRLHRQSGLSTPPSARRNARSSTPAPHPRPWANRTNRRTRIQNVLTRGATTFTDGRTSTGLCDYPVLPSANSRHMTSTGTHDPSLPTHT